MNVTFCRTFNFFRRVAQIFFAKIFYYDILQRLQTCNNSFLISILELCLVKLHKANGKKQVDIVNRIEYNAAQATKIGAREQFPAASGTLQNNYKLTA